MSEDRAPFIAPTEADRAAALALRHIIADQLRRAGVRMDIVRAPADDSAEVQAFARHAFEREASGRAAGREEAAKVADGFAGEASATLGPHVRAMAAVAVTANVAAARTIAKRIRLPALPVDAGKDGAA